jgi:hypothetical protein
MESLKEGVKFVFNKTILGALSLDMIAVLLAEPLRCYPFCTGYLKVGPQVWCFGGTRLLAFLMFNNLRLYSFYKKCWNEIIVAYFGHLGLHHCFGLSSIFGIRCCLFFSGCFDGFRW